VNGIIDEFDAILIETIEQTLSYVLGEMNTKIIFISLERNSCPKQEIPQKLEYFCEMLEKIIGGNRGQILGGSSILEYTIAEQLAKKLGKNCTEPKPIAFCAYVNRLKQEYQVEKRNQKKA